MALGAEGAAALDCFEVTLKCEEAEDDEEAVVVAVIPRPEPMLRGEGGGSSLPHGGRGLGPRFPALRRVPRTASAAPAGLPCRVRSGPRQARALPPPPSRFGIPGLSERPFLCRPSPAQSLDTSIRTERALGVFRFPAPPSGPA